MRSHGSPLGRRGRGSRLMGMDLFCGVDPGAQAGLVALDEHGRYVESVRLDHDDGTATRDWFEARRERIVLVGLEHCRPYIGNGVIGAFGLGRRFEQIRQTCICFRIPVMLIHAQTWQSTAGFSRPTKVTASLEGGYDEAMLAKAERKAKATNRDKLKRAITEHARLRWPGVKFNVKDELADACFLADHARRHHLGKALKKPTVPGDDAFRYRSAQETA